MMRIALALGDPNGIGPEIALKALQRLQSGVDDAGPSITVFGPRQVLQDTARRLGLEAVFERVALEATEPLAPQAWQPGRVDARAGVSAVQSASAALRACQAGRFDAVVACPHHEMAMHQAGIVFSGYPSLVAAVCGLAPDEVFLLLIGGGLRIVHATLHESVRSALGRLTPDLVVRAARAGIRGCALLGVPSPRVGVFGINPHASEGGLFGDEDARLVAPAVQHLQAEGHRVDGPTGADVLLAAREHDLYVAMLHDQGHIPVKLLAPQAASALSVGGSVLLASVGHGSAMDIAGRGIARPDALLRTLQLLSGAPRTKEGSA